jgi:hypothetical protein
LENSLQYGGWQRLVDGMWLKSCCLMAGDWTAVSHVSSFSRTYLRLLLYLNLRTTARHPSKDLTHFWVCRYEYLYGYFTSGGYNRIENRYQRSESRAFWVLSGYVLGFFINPDLTQSGIRGWSYKGNWVEKEKSQKKPLFRIRWIRNFLGLREPDPLVWGTDPEPDPKIIKKK